MLRVARRTRTPLAWWICLFGGAFGINSLLTVVAGDTVAGVYLLVVIAVALGLAASKVGKRLPPGSAWVVYPLLILAALPYAHLVAAVRQGNTTGTFTYVFRFAPYATIAYWTAVTRRDGLTSLTRAMKIYACIIAFRQVVVFAVPAFSLHAGYDCTYVYEWVGPVPRVFGAGMMTLDIAVLLYVGDWLSKPLSRRQICGLCLVSAGVLTGMSRGAIAVLGGCIVFMLLLALPRASSIRRLTLELAAGAGVLSGVLLLLVTSTGLLSELVPGSRDRLSTDASSLEWRQSQVDRAFLMQSSWTDYIFGAGTNTFVQNDPHDRTVFVNELHFSFMSILWTFGALGLAALLAALAAGLVLGFRPAQLSPLLLPWYAGLIDFIANGLYTSVFTDGSCALCITICLSAVLAGRNQPCRIRSHLRVIWNRSLSQPLAARSAA